MKKVQKLPTIRRLPTYLYKLNEMRKSGVEIVATPELARYMNLEAIVVRKDLAFFNIGNALCDSHCGKNKQHIVARALFLKP